MLHQIKFFIQQVTLVGTAMVCVYLCNFANGSPFLKGMPDTPINGTFSNPCVPAGETNLERWGDGCQFLCNCKNNTPCLSTGFCPDGCESGWEQGNTEPLTCVKSTFMSTTKSLKAESNRSNVSAHHENVDASEEEPEESSEETTVTSRGSRENEIDDDSMFFKDNYDPPGPFIDNRQIHMNNGLLDQGLSVYSFASSLDCEEGENVMHMSLKQRPDTPLAIKYLYFHHHSHVLFELDTVKAEFSLSDYSDPHVQLIPRETNQNASAIVFIKRLQPEVIGDEFRISFDMAAKGRRCRETFVTGLVILYGIPVCPYRRWGVRCENYCRCPCYVPECHPITGSCLMRSDLCPSGTFGRRCEKVCSESCLGMSHLDKYNQAPSLKTDVANGDSREHVDGKLYHKLYQSSDRRCHAVSGFCQICPQFNQTGPSCNIARVPEQMRDIISVCTNETHLRELSGNDEIEFGYFNLFQRSDEDQQSNTWRGQIALLVVAICILLFMLGFGVYVTCVRCVARRRLRDYMHRLDRQRMLRTSIKSWSDLREEFRDMRTSTTHILDNGKKADVRASISAVGAAAVGPNVTVVISDCAISESSVDPGSDYLDDSGAIKKVSFK